jgi:hypothetical protein
LQHLSRSCQHPCGARAHRLNCCPAFFGPPCASLSHPLCPELGCSCLQTRPLKCRHWHWATQPSALVRATARPRLPHRRRQLRQPLVAARPAWWL